MADSVVEDTAKIMDKGWENVQKKTFTRWLNTHLKKHGVALEEIEKDFADGINLIFVVNALFDTELPRYNKTPKMRPHKLDNVALGFKMIDDAGVKTNFLKPEHLLDEDLKMILGMAWTFILEYQIKGISVEEMNAKEGLLLWCQKKTKGYRDVKVDNFTTSWKSGMAFCALIHRHYPDLIDYDSLVASNNTENLELAFSVAEEKLDIPRLLDPEDLTDVARPDDKAVMTQVSEYFLKFASLDMKETAARRIQKFVMFKTNMEERESTYESNTQTLTDWINEKIEELNSREFGESYDEVQNQFEGYKDFISKQKAEKASEKLDLESEYQVIKVTLAKNNRVGYDAPEGLRPEDVDEIWDKLGDAEKERGVAIRNQLFNYVTKMAAEDASPDQIKEFTETFNRFDKDQDGFLDTSEFKAVLASLGIPFKDEASFLEVFDKVRAGNEDGINLEQFINYMKELVLDKDTSAQIKQSFKVLADERDVIGADNLKVQPLEANEIDYLVSNLSNGYGDSEFDYSSYTDSCFDETFEN